MTTIDGGVLTMRDLTKAKKARRVRWFGLPKGVPRTKLDVSHIGFKYNMNNVSAVIGLSQLENIHKLINKHITYQLATDVCCGISFFIFEK